MSRPDRLRAQSSQTVTTGVPEDTETEVMPSAAPVAPAASKSARDGYEYVTLKMALVGRQPGDEVLIESSKVARLRRLGVV
jgi:hypothetical protein